MEESMKFQLINEILKAVYANSSRTWESSDGKFWMSLRGEGAHLAGPGWGPVTLQTVDISRYEVAAAMADIILSVKSPHEALANLG